MDSQPIIRSCDFNPGMNENGNSISLNILELLSKNKNFNNFLSFGNHIFIQHPIIDLLLTFQCNEIKILKKEFSNFIFENLLNFYEKFQRKYQINSSQNYQFFHNSTILIYNLFYFK